MAHRGPPHCDCAAPSGGVTWKRLHRSVSGCHGSTTRELWPTKLLLCDADGCAAISDGAELDGAAGANVADGTDGAGGVGWQRFVGWERPADGISVESCTSEDVKRLEIRWWDRCAKKAATLWNSCSSAQASAVLCPLERAIASGESSCFMKASKRRCLASSCRYGVTPAGSTYPPTGRDGNVAKSNRDGRVCDRADGGGGSIAMGAGVRAAVEGNGGGSGGGGIRRCCCECCDCCDCCDCCECCEWCDWCDWCDCTCARTCCNRSHSWIFSSLGITDHRRDSRWPTS